MVELRIGRNMLPALLLLFGCRDPTDELPHAQATSTQAAIRSFAATVANDRETYDAFLMRTRSPLHRRNVAFHGKSVPALDVAGIGGCFPRDNREDFYANGRWPHPVNEFNCFADAGKVLPSDLLSGFGEIYPKARNPDQFGPTDLLVGLPPLPAGFRAYEFGFATHPAANVWMTATIVTDVDLNDAIHRSGEWPRANGVLERLAGRLTVRHISFFRDDTRQAYAEHRHSGR